MVGVARFLAALATLAVLFAAAPATTQAPVFEQVRHRAWRVADGAPSNIQGLAQSPDGFLWLASATGLYRSDGLTFDRIPLEGGDGSQSLQIASVAAAPNGDVWIGYDWGGMAVYRNGRLRPANPGPPATSSVYLAVTPDGAVWARAPGRKGNRLVRYQDGRWTDIDESWNLPPGTNSIALLVASDGSLYLANPDGVRRLPPGERRFQFQPLDTGYGPTLAEDPRGRIWLANSDQLFRVEVGTSGPGGRIGPVVSLPASNLYRRLVFDAEGAAWIGGAEDGVLRLLPDDSGERFLTVPGRFGAADGLSSQVTLSMTRDSEGNVWVGTLLGLDRFGARGAIRSAGFPLAYVFDTYSQAGEAYLVSHDTLFRIGPDGPERLAGIRAAETICGVRNGAVVVATPSALFSYAGGRVRPLARPTVPGDSDPRLYACALDSAGRLLVSTGRHPLYRLEAGTWRPVGPTPAEIAYGFIPAPQGGTLVIYPKNGRILRLDGDRLETLWVAGEQSIGFIKTAAAGRQCTLLGGQNGLGCLKGRAMKTLSAETYPQLTNITGIAETPQGWTWLIALSGIMRVRTAELHAAFDEPGRTLAFQPFGAEDGLRGETMMMFPRDLVADAFGRLWFFTASGLVTLDPASLGDARVPPRAVIESVVANGRTYDAHTRVILPVGTRSFEIDYTATALSDPEGTTFRYRLDDIDEAWTEAGHRRQAFYTNLGPGSYRFRVSAMNSAGVASREEAVLEIEIEPSIVQTRAFLVALAALALVLAGVLYRWRVRSLAARLNERMQERMDERERIARELHDTLLQGVSGLLLQFQSLASRVPADQPLRRDMETALDRAEDVVVEGRNRVHSLRLNEGPRDLEEVLTLALMRPGLESPVDVRLESTGAPRAVNGEVAAELGAIAVEAMGNAIRHGGARTVAVTLGFENRRLRVSLADDGSGIPPEIAAAGGRAGHFGLVGMRERAGRLGGTLEVGRGVAGGTRIAVSIPGRAAYPRRGWLAVLVSRLSHRRGMPARSHPIG